MESTPAIGGSTVLHPSSIRAPHAPHAPRHRRQQAIRAGGAIAIAILLFWQVDVPLANWLAASPLPKELQKLLEAAEHFGTVYGQLFIFAAIYALHPAGRWSLVRFATTAWSAGLAANVVKLCIARSRPKYFDFEVVTAAHGFLGLFPFGAGGSRSQSFPSAHTATAVGFCIALSHVYPRGRWVFWTLAAMVGLQRLESHSHFASDVVAGALVGWIVGGLMCGPTRLGRRWDEFEAARS